MIMFKNIKSGNTSLIDTDYVGIILTKTVVVKPPKKTNKAEKIAEIFDNILMTILESLHHAGLIKILP